MKKAQAGISGLPEKQQDKFYRERFQIEHAEQDP